MFGAFDLLKTRGSLYFISRPSQGALHLAQSRRHLYTFSPPVQQINFEAPGALTSQLVRALFSIGRFAKFFLLRFPRALHCGGRQGSALALR